MLCLLVSSADNLCKHFDQDQARQNFRPDLDPNCSDMLNQAYFQAYFWFCTHKFSCWGVHAKLFSADFSKTSLNTPEDDSASQNFISTNRSKDHC